MFGLDLAQIAHVVQGRLTGEYEGLFPVGAAIDTRKLHKNELFFALQGTSADGHSFITAAKQQGAIAAVVSWIPDNLELESFPLILVKDTEKALQQLAAAQRKLFSGPVIAITGSTGKTTTKDMLSAILLEKGEILSTIGNYNNQLGLPLTILSMQPAHWAIIVEMGMRALGEIDFLSVIARPTHGIITNIGHTHQELLGSQQKIAQAKAELISHLPIGGGMVLNMSDKLLLKPWLKNLRCPVKWVCTDRPADYWAEDIADNGLQGVSYKICSDEGRFSVSLSVPGRHNIMNSLAPAAIARMLGLTWQMITDGLSNVRLSAMRLETIEVPGKGLTIINDAYNANPTSMISALEILAAAAGNRRTIAVLGDMYELGDYSIEGHRLVGVKAAGQNIAYLITVGQLAAQIAEGAKKAKFPQARIRACQNNAEAVSYLMSLLCPGDIILIKGSRGVKMEGIAAELSAVRNTEE